MSFSADLLILSQLLFNSPFRFQNSQIAENRTESIRRLPIIDYFLFISDNHITGFQRFTYFCKYQISRFR